MSTTTRRQHVVEPGSQTDAPRPAWQRVAPVAMAHLAVDLAAGAFLATLPATIARLGHGGATFGALVALFSVTALGLQPLLGNLADRFGHRTTAAFSAAVSGAALMAAAVAGNIVLLALGLTVGGLAAAAFHPAAATLARNVGTASPEAAVATFAAAGTMGLALGPVVGITLMERTVGSMLLLAVPAALAGAALVVPTPPTDWAPRTRRSGVTHVVRSLQRLMVPATLVSIAATAISSTVPLLIARQAGRSTTDIAIGVSLATFSLAMAAGGVLGSALARHAPPSAILRAGLVTGAVAGALSLLTDPAGSAFVALLGVTGLAIGPAVPLLLVAAQDRLPDDQAAASGVVLGLANGLAGLAFMAVAATHDVLGLDVGLMIALGGLVPAAVVAGDSIGRRRLARHARCTTTTCGCSLPILRLARP